jgi:hypothetical protein
MLCFLQARPAFRGCQCSAFVEFGENADGGMWIMTYTDYGVLKIQFSWPKQLKGMAPLTIAYSGNLNSLSVTFSHFLDTFKTWPQILVISPIGRGVSMSPPYKSGWFCNCFNQW